MSASDERRLALDVELEPIWMHVVAIHGPIPNRTAVGTAVSRIGRVPAHISARGRADWSAVHRARGRVSGGGTTVTHRGKVD